MHPKISRLFTIFLLALSTTIYWGCEGYKQAVDSSSFRVQKATDPETGQYRSSTGTFASAYLGQGGNIDRGGSGIANVAPGGGGGYVVNGYLWRASLETVGFMPIDQADPFGGVIITDWASVMAKGGASAGNERYKVNVFIFGNVLRGDAVRVQVFKQKLTGQNWLDVAISPDVANKLELAILTRAREIKQADR